MRECRRTGWGIELADVFTRPGLVPAGAPGPADASPIDFTKVYEMTQTFPPESTQPSPSPREFWKLRLYVVGVTPRATEAFANLNRICEEHVPGSYDIEVVDLLENPRLAAEDQILAVPTLVRKLPEPMKKIIGDLSNADRVLVGLDLLPR